MAPTVAFMEKRLVKQQKENQALKVELKYMRRRHRLTSGALFRILASIKKVCKNDADLYDKMMKEVKKINGKGPSSDQ